MLDLATIQTTRPLYPPRILIYGPPGMGKTTLAGEFPAPLLVNIEDGAPPRLDIAATPQLETYDAVLDVFQALLQQQHSFQTMVLDSIDRLETLIWQEVCRRNNWGKEQFDSYGRGYKQALELWGEVGAAIEALRKAGIATVCLGHSRETKYEDPRHGSYTRFSLRIHESAAPVFEDMSDAIFFLNQAAAIVEADAGFNRRVTRASGTGQRWIYCSAEPVCLAKNRFGIDGRILYTLGQGFAEIAKHVPYYNQERKKTDGAS